MKRRLVFGVTTVALALNLAIGAAIYLNSARAIEPKDSAEADLDLFANVMGKIRAEYVDGTNLTYRDLTYSAIKGMVNSLDPHSEFLDVRDYQQFQDNTQGQFGGLGLFVEPRDGYVTVIAPMEDTPGFRAGILPEDRIVKVNGRDVTKLPIDEVVKLLRGEPGTKVMLTIQRSPTNELNFKLTRAIIQIEMVKDINGRKDFPLGPDGIGYVRITEFGERTADELQAALDRLQAQGMKALILDLRFNPGGLLNEAVDVCGKFLPRGQLVVSTEGRDPAQDSILHADGQGDELKGEPIVILVNLGSASASEIVSGCLQDLHRAVILGERTFGKGLVETVFQLDDGSALKLTVAKYYTPSHKVIEQRGIEPDILVPMSDEQQAALLLTRAPGGLEALSPTNRVQVAQIQDVQLERAQDLLKGMLLYGQLKNQPVKMAVK